MNLIKYKDISDLELVYDGYYHITNDFIKYPRCVIYFAYSMRGPGKTYGFLKYCAEYKKKFVYVRRTNILVNSICTGYKNPLLKEDPSPFAPINRDMGWNIKPVLVEDGMGYFIQMDEEGNQIGEPLGWIISLNKAAVSKGMDFSSTDYVCFDELIPQSTERVSLREGDSFLDLVMTCSRDRVARGMEEIKIVCFANSEDIVCPMTYSLDIIDDLADLNNNPEQAYIFNDKRHIMIHHILPEEAPKAEENKKTMLYECFEGTEWGEKAFNGVFTKNDFSNILYMNIKKMRCMYRVDHRGKEFYIYLRESDGMYYMSESKSNKYLDYYDLKKENDQKRFWIEHGQELRIECMEDRFKFAKYSMYNLVINFKMIFKV